MNWKKLILFALCIALIASLAACGGSSSALPFGNLPGPGETAASGESAAAPSEAAPAGDAGDVTFPALTYTFLQGVTMASYEDGVLRVRSSSGAAEAEVPANILSGEGVCRDGTAAYPELYRDGDYRYFRYADGTLTELTDWGFYHACSRDGRTAISRVGSENRIVVYRDGQVIQTIEDHGIDFVMSPDGSAALWSSYADDDVHPTLRLWLNGTVTDLGKDLSPVAVADGGTYLYFRIGGGGPLYVQRGTDSNTAALVQRVWVDSLVVFNEDFSEVLAAGEHSAWWSVQGRPAVEVPADAIHVILPDNALYYPTDTWGGSDRCAGISTFQGSLFVGYDGDGYTLWQLDWLDGSPVATEIDKTSWDDPKLSADGAVLIYQRDGSLCRAAADFQQRWTGSETVPPTELVSGLGRNPFFAVSADGSTVYYRSGDGLMAWTGDGTRLVSETASSCEVLGATAVFFEGGALWSEENGHRTELLPGVAGLRILGSTPELVLVEDNHRQLYTVDGTFAAD